MQTQKTLDKIGVTPNQIMSSMQKGRILVLEDNLHRIERIPHTFYEQFGYLDEQYKNPLYEFLEVVKMEIIGWGRFDGQDVQMYRIDDAPWLFCAEKGSILDRYLKALFDDEKN